MAGLSSVTQRPVIGPSPSVNASKPATQAAQGENAQPLVCQDEAPLCQSPSPKDITSYAKLGSADHVCRFAEPAGTGQAGHEGKPVHGKAHGMDEHEKTSVAGHVAHDVGVNVAHHACEHAIEHAAGHAGEHVAGHALARAAEHGAGEVVAHGAAHIGGRIAAVAAPGVGAVAAGYLAYKGVEHSVHAAQKGHVGASLAFALAATVDGTTAAVNGAGAVSGAGVVISTPVSLILGAAATGLSALGAWLDD